MQIDKPIVTKPVLGKDFVEKITGFKEWILENKRKFEEKYKQK